ncbi:uncharacterized protein EV154DRAFT_493866 [Mucor mucedo]|uniref:uncharacterized protein n=1 Tax=Mucor mucedo TaxID=29922 RepID=UPI00221E3A9F|nr:uncharacterized protein EV154DRAFT_493866 [Mucor mucedo]KAI7895817.1 hypothetical protein EV154DRAFT_493866 [Mucor mucedo]
MNKKVNVIGSGVIGLTSALLLQERGYEVTIIASEFPGEQHAEYTSPSAGARWKTLAPNSDLRLQRHDAVSFKFFWELAKSNAGNSGIMVVSAFDYYEEEATKDQLDPWWKTVVPTFQMIDRAELPKGISFGYYYTTVVINPLVYLPWLMNQFLNLGGLCQRQTVHDLSDVITGVDIVVNCTGIRAKELTHDASLIPTRGHNVLVKAPHIRKTMSMVRKKNYTYVIPRTDGTVILGTTKDEHGNAAEVNEKTTLDILQRATQCCPELSPDGVQSMQVLENIVGYRPTRKGGPRIQNEFYVSKEGKKTLITHNYGHGGSGYQSSWGSCQEAVRLVEEGHAYIENDRYKIKQLFSRL